MATATLSYSVEWETDGAAHRAAAKSLYLAKRTARRKSNASPYELFYVVAFDDEGYSQGHICYSNGLQVEKLGCFEKGAV